MQKSCKNHSILHMHSFYKNIKTQCSLAMFLLFFILSLILFLISVLTVDYYCFLHFLLTICCISQTFLLRCYKTLLTISQEVFGMFYYPLILNIEQEKKYILILSKPCHILKTCSYVFGFRSFMFL